MEGRYQYDDTSPYYEETASPEVPHFNISFEAQTMLNINIGTQVSQKAQKELLDMLKIVLAMGNSSVKIQIKEFSDTIRSIIAPIRERLQEEADINIESDCAEEDDDNEMSDTRSQISSTSSRSNQVLKGYQKQVDFPKTSDLVIIKTCKEIFQRIRNFAYTNQVTFKTTPKGFFLRADEQEDLDKVEDMIQKTLQSLLPFKEFEGLPTEKIQTISQALKNVKENLRKDFHLKNVYTITSTDYYETYQKLALEVPALQEKLRKKKKKKNLRIVLENTNIRQRQDIATKFRQSLLDNSKPFVEVIKIVSSENLTPAQLKQISKNATEFNLCLKHEFKKIAEQSTFKFKNTHHFTLVSYYSKETEKKALQNKAGILKEKITNILRPSLLYIFNSPDDRVIFNKFVYPEIESDLKESDIELTVVQNDTQNNNQPFENNKNKKPTLALNIRGDRAEAKRIQQKIVKLMSQIGSSPYYLQLNDPHAGNIIRLLTRQENETFFSNCFKEIYLEHPNVKLILSSQKKLNAKQNKMQNQNNEDVYQEEYNLKEKKNSHKQHEEFEPIIRIFSKRKEDLNGVREKLDKIFKNVISIRKNLNLKLNDLLARAGTNLEEFKRQHQIVVSEGYNHKSNRPYADIIGESENAKAAVNFMENVNSASKPITERIEVESKLLLNILRHETKNLSPPGVNWRFFSSFITLFGEARKIGETKKNIQLFSNAKKQQIKQRKIDDMPISYIKAIEEDKKWYLDLQKNNQIELRLIKPNSSKLQMTVGLENQASKSLVIVEGDITKIQVDAIVNSTDLQFGKATIIQGIAKAILDKAGEEFVEECQAYGQLKETEIFTSGPGKLDNCKGIINVCPPFYKSDAELPNTFRKLKECIQNVLKEAFRCNFESIAVPFISAGNYGIPAQEAISCIIEELASGLFSLNSSLKRILVCEIDSEKHKIAEKKIKSIISGEKQSEHEVNYQWQWLDDGAVWTNYDLQVNRIIDDAFSKGEKTVEIKFPATRSITTHRIDVKAGILTRKSTGQTSKIERKGDGWYENGVKMSDDISEIIDLKNYQGNQTFEIFLNEYSVDLVNMRQFNKQTQFTRKIQKIELDKQPKQVAHKLVFPGVNLMKQAALRQGKIYGSIIIEGLTEESVKKAEAEIQKYLNNLKTQAEIDIHPKIGEENLMYIKNKIERHQIIVQGELKEGKKAKITGIKSEILKIQSRLQTVNDILKQFQLLPEYWSKMDDDNFCLVPLNNQDKEWKFVEQKFKETLPNRQIVKIHRIQNIKFWQDYRQERENLSKAREKAGLNPNIKEEFLWHGTRANHPQLLYAGMDECFDMQCANDGVWGRGIYFAVNASYSDAYAFNTPSNSKLFMLCHVIVGDAISLQGNSSLRKAPERPDAKHKIDYESVKGNTGGSDVYILYRMRRAYPEYLIEFK